MPKNTTIYFFNKALILFQFTLLFIFSLSILAQNLQPNNLSFWRLNSLQGLSSNNVNCIIRDKNGFVWIGTNNGLNRFDGYNFKVFRNIYSDSLSIGGNNIITLFIDNNNNFWISTSNGISLYDPIKGIFINYKTTYKKFWANYFYQDSNQKIWIGTNSGLFEFNFKNQKLSLKSINSATNISVVGIVEYKNSLLLAAWEAGILKYNLKTQKTEKLFYDQTSFKNNYIIKLYVDKNEILWIGKYTGGLTLIDLKNGKEIIFKPKSDKLINYSPVHDINSSGDKTWIATEKGLQVFSSNNNFLNVYLNNPYIQTTLSTNYIKSIYNDNEGLYWISTYDGGINVHHTNNPKFTNRVPGINLETNKFNKSVKSIYIDKQNNIWVGTDYGLNLLNNKREIIKTLIHNPSDITSLNVGGICSMLEDKKGQFWVGNWGGSLHLFNKQQNKFKRFAYNINVKNSPNFIADPNIVCMVNDSSGNIWISTVNGTIDKLNIITGIFTHYFFGESNCIRSMVVDTLRNKLWFGSFNGLGSIDMTTGKTFVYNDEFNFQINPNDKNINFVIADHNMNLWLATSNGLVQFQPDSNKIKYINKNNGMESEQVYTIAIDHSNCLWASGDKGITKYDPEKGKCWNFNHYDGLIQNLEYSYMSNNGEVFFFGANGIVSFFPDSLKMNDIAPAVYITDFQINNTKVISGKGNILSNTIEYTKEITLSYKDNIFAFSFSALNYQVPEKTQYAYMLKGFDTDWNYVGNRRTAYYTDIPHGKYVFKVKASNNDGVWNETGTSVKIIILPPFWKTLWFKVIISLLFVTAIYLWKWYRINLLSRQQEVLEKLVKHRTAQLNESNEKLFNQQQEVLAQKEEMLKLSNQLHESDTKRIRFLINISHEFRTPLTLIIGPLEQIVEKIKGNNLFSSQLSIIYQNAQRLLRMVNQILDIRKIEVGAMELQVSNADMVLFCKNIFDSFAYLASEKNINYTFKYSHDSYMAWFDHDKVEKSVYNLLSNAFKFTLVGGEIELFLDFTYLSDNAETQTQNNNGNWAIIKVIDNGIGIDPENLDKIFDRFYQIETPKKNKQEGTGIGLNLAKDLIEMHHGKISITSKPNEGSTFTITIPIDKEFYSKYEIIESGIETLTLNYNANIIEPQLEWPTISAVDNENNDKCEKDLILLVEDNIDLRNFISTNLTPFYKVLEAEDGEKGWLTAITEIPDLIVSDLMMPIMDGLELCHKIKSDIKTNHIPFILLTARVDEEGMLKGFNKGADDYVVKPFNLKILLARINNLLETRRELRKKYSKIITTETAIIEGTSIEEKFIKQAITIIDKNLANPDLNISLFTFEMGMSQANLYRKFKAIVNQSPDEFIRLYRLKRAAQMLHNKELTILEIAYEVGYKNASHFTQNFVNQYGKTPTNYRKDI